MTVDEQVCIKLKKNTNLEIRIINALLIYLRPLKNRLSADVHVVGGIE